jgi:hypothetical protein
MRIALIVVLILWLLGAALCYAEMRSLVERSTTAIGRIGDFFVALSWPIVFAIYLVLSKD